MQSFYFDDIVSGFFVQFLLYLLANVVFLSVQNLVERDDGHFWLDGLLAIGIKMARVGPRILRGHSLVDLDQTLGFVVFRAGGVEPVRLLERRVSLLLRILALCSAELLGCALLLAGVIPAVLCHVSVSLLDPHGRPEVGYFAVQQLAVLAESFSDSF